MGSWPHRAPHVRGKASGLAPDLMPPERGLTLGAALAGRRASDGAAPWRVPLECEDREWEPDPEIPGSEMHELVHADGERAGLTRFTTVGGPSAWTPSRRETIHLLEGEVTIEIAGGRRSSSSPATWPLCRRPQDKPGT
jgi:hypothetical protein